MSYVRLALRYDWAIRRCMELAQPLSRVFPSAGMPLERARQPSPRDDAQADGIWNAIDLLGGLCNDGDGSADPFWRSNSGELGILSSGGTVDLAMKAFKRTALFRPECRWQSGSETLRRGDHKALGRVGATEALRQANETIESGDAGAGRLYPFVVAGDAEMKRDREAEWRSWLPFRRLLN